MAPPTIQTRQCRSVVSQSPSFLPMSAPAPALSVKIGFLGAGVMGSAMIAGFLAKGVVSASAVIASDPVLASLDKIRDLGCNVTTSNKEVAAFADVLIVAVKVHTVFESRRGR